MKILSVNIRGFKRDGKVSWFWRMISSNNPIVAAVQETKSRSLKDRWIDKIWGSHNVEYVAKDTVGKSSGLLLMWESNVFSVNQAVEEIVVVNVYRPHTDEKKRKFWADLNALLQFNDVAWVLCGDYNEVRFEEEMENTNFVARREDMFNDFINNNGLIEIPIQGKKFTRISDEGTQFSKLDRFLVSDNFYTLWDDLYVVALDRKLSDHTPLMLKNGNTDYGSNPVKIFNAWLEDTEAEPIIVSAWNEEVSGSVKDLVFRLKLKKVKEKLKTWSKNSYGKIDEEIKALNEECKAWEQLAESKALTDEERKKWFVARGK
ncbi:uncharacterized protein [Rutidosis leptorrhynchoides]|uniref:uncharacterized protein n=1 Tax=Rutidosis leptorrhynchoides TaxID=125765 RepID=UPI003A992C5E